ncbi:tripartite tricarboxylate transporter substrate binding protein [Pseudacidovorax sp. RU35E]|uniref:Bug family tripartite tricarboxylate transporter substrate binding protein n=1 Tax=Pseudacidovorax sp. RU35E TaxID=1907403 RepID=UPI000954CDCF|nr:tripartite tricarboxylate transporter substrate binding protein [Pseudacidovorax sp. RU35E]SIR59111.1 Tripartite-type tricarboxylate transporter, receptor component TctC [Pseudacidovorax sp. RU35E]
MTIKRILTLALFPLLTLHAAAQSWPTKPVKVVVPAPAGSSLDFIVRTLGTRLSSRWGQPVIVDNKPGAGGMLGMSAVAKAAPDGYTLGIGFNGPIAFAPFMYKQMAYDPVKDLAPIVMTSSQPNVLAVPASHPARTVQEFVSWARAQPNGVAYGSVGAGSSSHLTMELLRTTAGFEATHVPFNGSPPAGISLASGETQALFTVAPALLPLVASGRIRLLAVTSAKRMEGMEQLPTIAESGYPGFEALAWNGLFSATGTPAAVVAKVNADVNAALKEPEVQAAFAKQGLVPGGGTPQALASFMAQERSKWGAIIQKTGIRLD